jgi:hypothetical protein
VTCKGHRLGAKILNSTNNITKRNHYNPCFWTALWNRDYYDAFLNDPSHHLRPRDQVVFALSVRGDAIFQQKVENLHYEEGLGNAEITFEAMKKFVKHNNSGKFDDFCREVAPASFPLILDYENRFTALESATPYKVLLNVIKRQDLESLIEKGHLADFVCLQWLRSHAILNSIVERSINLGFEKFESLIYLWWALSDRDLQLSDVFRLLTTHWTLYRTQIDSFPLTDSPILVQPYGIMLALSPRLLLEISLRVQARGRGWETRDDIDSRKLAEFRRRCIGNTFREIIFSERSLLEEWHNSKDFQKRVTLIKKKSYSSLVRSQGRRGIGLIDALRRSDQLPAFENRTRYLEHKDEIDKMVNDLRSLPRRANSP